MQIYSYVIKPRAQGYTLDTIYIGYNPDVEIWFVNTLNLININGKVIYCQSKYSNMFNWYNRFNGI